GERIDHGDHFHEGGIDPHLWMSPKVMLEILPAIKQTLMEVYPHLSETIENNYSVLKSDVELVHSELQDVVSGLRIRSFMIFHPALTYLARDYGLEQISIEYEGKEPSPGQLSHIIRKARNENISVIFVQEEYDVRNAQLVAEETGAEVVQINPLAYDWMSEMRNLANAFNTYLK
ncbi:MAG: zinc ABC transporter substrate-binding protein, partial [Bacteroidetes bacterium]